MNRTVKTAVIGSYPVSIDAGKVMDHYFNQTPISWQPYIKTAVTDMISAGIAMVSDGQTRDPFIQIFTRKLQGCRVRARTEIIDTITYTQPITIEDQQYVRTVIPKNREIIGVLTGPYTLMRSSVDMFYHNDEQLARDFAHALHQEALELQKYVDSISVDEPFFSQEFPPYAKELLEIIFNGIQIPKRLHVCGDVSTIIPSLVDMPVDILSHEFKASPQLLEVFAEYPHTKQICLGCVRSDDTRVEPVDEIIEHIKKAQHIFGDSIVQLAPDCGQRMLPRSIAHKKLTNLVKAGEQLYGR
jgi:5-methyltetrahydropteroyltriglutamate--homocysteine methyltransferase